MIDTDYIGPAPDPRRPAARPAPQAERRILPPSPGITYVAQPAPAAKPGHVAIPSWLVGAFLAFAVTLFLFVVLPWLVHLSRTPDNPSPAPTNGVALGRSFAPKLSEALAEGFDAEADALEHGKTVGEADTALKESFHAARTKAFAEHAAATFGAVVPAGTEPKDEAIRKAFAGLHRDFARGLREARP